MVSRFNQEGLLALELRHGGGPSRRYGRRERERILAGFSSEGTPVGVQFGTAWFEEPRLLQLAHAFEQATNWHTLHPPDPIAAKSARFRGSTAER